MKIIKSRFFSPKKCEYGNFIIIPEEGWKLSQTFIDYESKLLIVSVSNTDETKWENHGYNGTVIPTRQYKVNLKTLKILEFKNWKHYFDYNEIEILSEDGKYKLKTQRIYEPERNNDKIHEELYDVESRDLLSMSDSIAFREDKRENLLESRYRSEREIEEQRRIYNAKPNLEEFFKIQISKLVDNEVVIYYYDDFDTYKLTFQNNKFVLYKGNELPAKQEDWALLHYQEITIYCDIDQFWKEFAKDRKWYLKYKIHYGFEHKILVLAKHITEYFNDLRKEHKATFEEYDKVNTWQGSVWSDEYKKNEIKQWCPHCGASVHYFGRYPKYICRECSSKDAFDKDGNFLDFTNLGISGGFKIITKNKEGKIMDEDDTQQFCDCFIDGKLFFAQEARFGGTVIQLKE